jgi:hypothetical protein
VTGTAAATALYAYAVVGPVTHEVRTALGDELELIGGDELAVVVGEVPLSEFGEDVLPERLNDRRWLEETVRAHEGVVRRLFELTTVVPLRFGSIHRDRASVRSFLEAEEEAFASTVERIRGRVELGVKVWRSSPSAAPEAVAPATGREYLERRKLERERAQAAAADLGDRLSRIHGRLLGAAEAGTLNRPQPSELTGSEQQMVMNAAYLVRAGDATLAAEVERLRSENGDLAFDITGPWAPYNFVDGEAG